MLNKIITHFSTDKMEQTNYFLTCLCVCVCVVCVCVCVRRRILCGALIESIEHSRNVGIVCLPSYLGSVLCKYPNKLLRVGLAAFGQEPRTQNLCPLSHLQGRRSAVTQKQQNMRHRGVEGLKCLYRKSNGKYPSLHYQTSV